MPLYVISVGESYEDSSSLYEVHLNKKGFLFKSSSFASRGTIRASICKQNI